MRFLTLEEVIQIHDRMIGRYGGSVGIRDQGGLLESAIAKPQMTFGDEDLYTTIEAKAAALGYSLVKNHPFLDGNKRTGYAAMEIFLGLNGYEIKATVDEQERIILQVASGGLNQDQFTYWLRDHILGLL